MDSPEPGVEPGEGGRQAQGGVVVAGGLVGAHRDAAPVLEPVEAAFDDVAALVAVAPVVVPDDGSAGPATSVGDLVVAVGDRRGDATGSKPGPVRLGRVSLVGDDPVRACAGPAGPAHARTGSSPTRDTRPRRTGPGFEPVASPRRSPNATTRSPTDVAGPADPSSGTTTSATATRAATSSNAASTGSSTGAASRCAPTRPPATTTPPCAWRPPSPGSTPGSGLSM